MVAYHNLWCIRLVRRYRKLCLSVCSFFSRLHVSNVQTLYLSFVRLFVSSCLIRVSQSGCHQEAWNCCICTHSFVKDCVSVCTFMNGTKKTQQLDETPKEMFKKRLKIDWINTQGTSPYTQPTAESTVKRIFAEKEINRSFPAGPRISVDWR